LVEESAVALVEWGEIASSVFGLEVMSVDFSIDAKEGRALVVTGALSEGRADELDAWANQ